MMNSSFLPLTFINSVWDTTHHRQDKMWHMQSDGLHQFAVRATVAEGRSDARQLV